MIRRFLLLFLAAFIFCPVALSQVTSHTAYRIVFGPTNPATCSPATGDVFFNTTSNLPEFCSAPNTWSTMGGGSGSGTVNSASQFSIAAYPSTGTTVGGIGPAAGYAGVAQSLSCITGSPCTIAPEGVTPDATNPATLPITDRLGWINWTSGASMTVPALTSGNGLDQNVAFHLTNTSGGAMSIIPTTPNNIRCGTASMGTGQAPCSVPNDWTAFVFSDNSNLFAVLLPMTSSGTTAQSLVDTNSLNVVAVATVASQVNRFVFTPAITGSDPTLLCGGTGSDSTVGCIFGNKGQTGYFRAEANGTAQIASAANQNVQALLGNAGSLEVDFSGSGNTGYGLKAPGRVQFTNVNVTASSCTFTSGGGTTPSCALDTGSTDANGIIIATTGSGSPAGTGTITLTFGQSYGTNKPVCTYMASDAGAGAWNGLAVMKDKTPAVTSDLFTWTNGTTPTALTASTAYWINYHCYAK